MSIIKQKAVTEKGHAKNLRNYINDDKALLHDFQKIDRPERWSDEMNQSREFFGHNTPSRDGAKNTIMYHQVLAFLCEEIDIYGGKMTPELCMRYAKEYAATRYPDHKVAFALHKEHCEEDGTDRYAVHMAINRTNECTGNRLHEGTGEQAKRARAAFVRKMDAEWGLQQVEEGVPNSKIHARQPQRIGTEKAIIDRARKRGIDPIDASYKSNLRELCRIFRNRATSLEEYRDMLASYGVETEIKDGKAYATDADNRKYKFSLVRLDRALTVNDLEAAFERNAGDKRMAALEAELREKRRQIESYAATRKDYLSVIEGRYRDYRELARSMEGARFEDFPKIKMPRMPEALSKDMKLKQTVLSYVYKGDELRLKLASGVPRASKGQPAGTDEPGEDRTL